MHTLWNAPLIAEMVGAQPEPRMAKNIASVIAGLETRGDALSLDQPEIFVCYIAQLGHESARFRYDQEIASGEAYEGRKDLGNVYEGDGRRFKGRGPIQITGRYNYRQFTRWARENIDPRAPDFEADPDKVNTDPWEGLVPIWYWETRDLTEYAQRGDMEMLTRRINGGLNGYRDRLDLYTRGGLAVLGYDEVRRFQSDAGILVDGIAGPQTRAALHDALQAMDMERDDTCPTCGQVWVQMRGSVL